MSRIKTFFAISITFISFSTAQSPGEGLSAIETRTDQHLSKIDLQMPINLPIDNGFYLELPGVVKMVPSSINLSGTEFWLKKSNEIPTNSKVAHWDFNDGKILFLFAAGVLNHGLNLNIIFQSHSINTQSESGTLTVRSLQGSASQNFQAGDVQSRVQLVQTEK